MAGTIIDELVAVLGYDLRGEADLTRFNQGLDAAANKARALAAAITTAATIAGAAAAAGFGLLGKSVIDTGSTFEKLNVQLKALEGSQEAANKAMEWITEFAKKTPLELEGVVRGYTSLKNYGIDPTNGSFQALVDTMAMGGKGQEQLQGIIMAVGQAWTKQKLQGEEAMQLMERGVPVWDLLSKAMGKTAPELMELASKGKIGRKEIALLIEEMGKRAKGASEEFAQTLEGITSNISDVWTGFKRLIADSGFYAAVKKQMQGVLDAMNRWAEDGTAKKVAAVFSNAFIYMMGVVGSTTERMVKHIAYLSENFAKLEPYLAPIGIALGIMAAIAFPVAAGFAAAAVALDDFLTYLRGGESIIGAALAYFDDFYKKLLDKWNSFSWRDLGQLAAQGVIAGLKALANLEGMNIDFVAIGNTIATKLWEGVQAFGEMWWGFWAEIDKELNELFPRLGKQMADGILNALRAITQPIKDWFNSLLPEWITGTDFSGNNRLLNRPQGAAPSLTPGGSGITSDDIGNLQRNLGRLGSDRNIPQGQSNNTTVNAPVTVNVREPSDAPGAVGNAVQGAVTRAAQPSRMQTGGAF